MIVVFATEINSFLQPFAMQPDAVFRNPVELDGGARTFFRAESPHPARDRSRRSKKMAVNRKNPNLRNPRKRRNLVIPERHPYAP